MPTPDFWSHKLTFPHTKILGRYELASVTIEMLTPNPKAQDLSTAFTLQFTVRGLGAQIGRLENVALKDGNPGQITIPLKTGGTLQGHIEGWEGTDDKGNAVGWPAADHVVYRLIGDAEISIPIAEIVALVPSLGWLLGIILKVLGTDEVPVTLGVLPVSLEAKRDRDGALIPIPD